MIFGYFKIRGEQQARILKWGIIGALVLRGFLTTFHWMFYLFGVLLLFTASKNGRCGSWCGDYYWINPASLLNVKYSATNIVCDCIGSERNTLWQNNYLYGKSDIIMITLPKPSSLTPLQRFSFITLCALFLFGLLFGILVTRSIEQNMLERSRQLSAEYISKVVSSEFSPQELSTPRSGADYAVFASKIGRIVLGPQVVRVKFWNSKRQIVWSDNLRLVGQEFRDNDELEEAFKGKVTSELSGLGKKEHASEKHHGALLELYVPIRSVVGGEIFAVVEVYQKLGTLLDDVSRQKRQIWMATSTGFLLLYLLLFGMFRQATLRIERQHLEKSAFQKRLIEAERQQMVSTIAASIGHELNNTLASMLFFSEMTQVPNPSMDLLQRFARSMPPLIQRLMSFGKNLLTIGHPPKPVFVPLDINDLLKRVTELLTESGMLKKLDVKLDVSPDFAYVHGDRGMLEQVITNLVINASHAMENGGKLSITSKCSQSTDFVSVEIADTGHGIPEENREKIFEPFFTTKEPGKGTGLGMYVVKQIIEEHGGTICLISSSGQGTVFLIQLPSAKPLADSTCQES